MYITLSPSLATFFSGHLDWLLRNQFIQCVLFNWFHVPVPAVQPIAWEVTAAATTRQWQWQIYADNAATRTRTAVARDATQLDRSPFQQRAHTAAVAVGDVYFMVTPLLFIDSGRRTRRRHQPHPHDIITRQHHPVRFIIIILNKIEMQRFRFDPWRFVDKYCPLSCVYVVFLFTETHLCLTCLITDVVWF